MVQITETLSDREAGTCGTYFVISDMDSPSTFLVPLFGQNRQKDYYVAFWNVPSELCNQIQRALFIFGKPAASVNKFLKTN
jgi:hypothetical protein